METKVPKSPREVCPLLAGMEMPFATVIAEDGRELKLNEVQQIRMKLLGTEIMMGLNKLNLPGTNFSNAKQLTKSALDAIQQGQLGYAIITASNLGSLPKT